MPATRDNGKHAARHYYASALLEDGEHPISKPVSRPAHPWPASRSPAHVAGPHATYRAGLMGHEEQALMPDPNDIPRRRRVLVLDVTQAAAEVSRLIHEAHDLNLPVEPGVRMGATRERAALGGPDDGDLFSVGYRQPVGVAQTAPPWQTPRPAGRLRRRPGQER